MVKLYLFICFLPFLLDELEILDQKFRNLFRIFSLSSSRGGAAARVWIWVGQRCMLSQVWPATIGGPVRTGQTLASARGMVVAGYMRPFFFFLLSLFTFKTCNIYNFIDSLIRQNWPFQRQTIFWSRCRFRGRSSFQNDIILQNRVRSVASHHLDIGVYRC